jgi:predicted TIM-barrel fold metal-dependent hydrolase
VSVLGSDKILFGTDLTYLDGTFQLGTVIYAKISDGDKRKILGLNMKNILDK